MQALVKAPEIEGRRSTKDFIYNSLMQGFLVLLPMTIILVVLIMIFRFIFKVLSPISQLIYPGTAEPHFFIHLISLFVLVLFVFIIGVSIQNRVGKTYFRVFERQYLKRIPLYEAIYELVYQFAGVKKLPFSQVVLIDPFKTGTMMTGFVTEQLNDDLYTIFVPTAPNPTNGLVYHVPKESITFLKASPQEAMRSVIGMGTGTAAILSAETKEQLST